MKKARRKTLSDNKWEKFWLRGRLMSEKKRNRSAVPQMRGRGRRSVQWHMSQADDKADVVLLNGYEKLANVYQLFRWLSSFSVAAKKRGDAEKQEYWYKMV